MERSFDTSVRATPEQVWEALTTPAGLQSWFVVGAEVTPGVGGSITVDWGGGQRGTETIEVWEPPTRLRLARDEHPAFAGHDDWTLTPEGEATKVTLTVSLPGDEEWTDDDDLSRGWTLFLENLRFVVEAGHRTRTTELRTVPLAGSRPLAWTRLTVAIGLPPNAKAGIEVFIAGVGPMQVRACFPDHSVLLAVADRATLFLDFEGEPASLYALAATYGPDTPEQSALRAQLVAVADKAGASITS